MKKLLYLLIMFAMVAATSCEKEDPVIVEPIIDPIITHAELQGQWNFVSFQHSDGNFYEYPYDCDAYGWYGSGDMEDWTINEETLDKYDLCEEHLYDGACYVLDLELNEIQFMDCINGELLERHKILEYNSTTKTLVLKKTQTWNYTGQWDGILTLQKQ